MPTYDSVLKDLSLDMLEILNNKYPRASDLKTLRRKSDRLGILLWTNYVVSAASAELIEHCRQLYQHSEEYLELHRFDLVVDY